MATKKTPAKTSRTSKAIPTPPTPPADGGEIAKKIANQNIAETIDRVSNTDLTKVIDTLGTLRVNLGTEILNIQGRIEQAFEEYNDVVTATNAETERLTALYGIEKEAQNLDAYKARAAAEMAELQAEIAEQREAWETEIAERDAEREREEREFQYNLKLTRDRERAVFDDTVARRNRDEKLRQEEVDRNIKAREAVIAAAEKELADLRTRAASFDAELQKAKDAGIATGRNIEKGEARTAATLAQAEFEKQVALKDGLITALTSQRDTLAAQLAAAQETAQKAMDRVAEISQSALTSASQKETMAALQNALASNGGAAKSGR